MAKVVSFEIEGLAGRRPTVTRSLDPHTNLFFGANGCGKTSVLRILHAALQNDPASLASVPFRAAAVVIADGASSTQVSYRMRKAGIQAAMDRRPHRLGMRVSMPSLPGLEDDDGWSVEPSLRHPGPWRHQYLPTTRMFAGIERARGAPGSAYDQELEDYANRVFKDVVEREWLTLFSRAQAEIRKVQEEGLATLLLDVLRTGESGGAKPAASEAKIAHNRATQFLRRLRRDVHAPKQETFVKRYSASPLLREIMAHIDEVEIRIESLLQPFERFQTQINRLFVGTKTLAAGANGLEIRLADDTAVDISALSSGEKQLIRLLMAAVAAEDSTIIIDEPELSMHIDWQREFVNTAQSLSPECQLIAATHSPEILADVPDAKIFQL